MKDEPKTSKDSTSSVFCRFCGHLNSQQSRLCTICGEPITKEGIKQESFEDEYSATYSQNKKSHLTSIRETQVELSRLITRKTAIIGILSFTFTLLIIITLSLGEAPNVNRISIGLMLLSFLSTVLSLVIDILRGKNYTEWSALGAIICVVGILFIFFPLMLYVISSAEDFSDFFFIFLELVGVALVAIGVTLRWTEYDEKLVNLLIMAINYWKNYQKREAIKIFFRAIYTFIWGLMKSIGLGMWHFPKRFATFLGMILRALRNYVETTIKQLQKEITQFFKVFWNHTHWLGLLAVFAHLWFTGVFSYQNLELLIIMSYFFVLGILFLKSKQVAKAVSNTRAIILKGAISAYSMLTGVKIKKEESLFCSRCLRGVHQIEFTELQSIENTNNPPCPYCGYQNWIAIT